METSSRWNVRYIAGRIMLGLVLTLMIGGINVTPAFSRDRDRSIENHSRYEHRGRGDHRRWHDRRVYRGGRYYYDSPDVYIPPPSPGIEVFFPPIIIRH